MDESSTSTSDQFNSSLLKIQSLENEFKIVMKQYEEAHLNYINSLNSNSNSIQNMDKSIIFKDGDTNYPKGTNNDKQKYEIMRDKTIYGYDIPLTTSSSRRSIEGCTKECNNTPECNSFGWISELTGCWLKDKNGINAAVSRTGADIYHKFSPENKNIVNMVSIPASTWNGTNALSEGPVKSVDECKAMCSNDSTCTGATYNSTKSYCWTKIGTGEVQASSDTTDIALVSDLTQNLSIIQSLNKRLSVLIQQIDNEMNKVLPEAKREIDIKNVSKGKLHTIYDQLKEDRIKIDNQLKEYQKIDQSYIDTNIYVNEKNSKYILWSIFAVIILFYTLKSMFFPNVSSNIFKFIFWIIMSILFMVTTTRLNSSAGFLLWGVLITLVIFIQMKFIPIP
jgi:hypothetical protein